MEKILLSIIVPTRGRLETLKYTLEALLKLNNQALEFVICDNASQDGTFEYLESIKDSRLRYFRTKVPLTMPQNFEYGLVNAKGDYLLMMGDDDLIIPNNLTRAIDLTSKKVSDIIYWNRWYFYWSSFQDQSIAGSFGISMGTQNFNIDTRTLLTLSFYGFLSYQYLPSIYNSIINKSFLLKYKSELRGRYFPDYVVSVDVFSSLIFSSMTPSTLYLESPVSVSGISHRSNGMSIFTDQNEFKRFKNELGINNEVDLIPNNMAGKINILTLNGKNSLGLMFDYYNVLENHLTYSMNSFPDLETFTRNYISKLIKNRDIEFKNDYKYLESQYCIDTLPIINEDPVNYFYRVFGIPVAKLYTGKFSNNDATSLSLLNHLIEINFNHEN